MSKKNLANTNKADTWAGVIALIVICAVFAALILAAVARNKGEISYETPTTRRATEQTLVYKNDKLKDGEEVRWFVDGEKIATSAMRKGRATATFVPQTEGEHVVKAYAGKYNASKSLQVLRPLLKICAQDVTITYGETPNLQFTCQGLVDGDTLQSLGLDVTCNAQAQGCGVFPAVVSCNKCETYDVELCDGTLTVLPKQLKIATSVVKTYDGKKDADCSSLQLEGVLDGEEVSAVCDKLYFQSKNAGKNQIVTANVQLVGKDSANYVLPSTFEGTILPKQLHLQGTRVANKAYDGTTKAQLQTLGQLLGVVDGDNVALGNLEVSFEHAQVGTQKVNTGNATLVGLDKDNYVLQDPQDLSAEIIWPR